MPPDKDERWPEKRGNCKNHRIRLELSTEAKNTFTRFQLSNSLIHLVYEIFVHPSFAAFANIIRCVYVNILNIFQHYRTSDDVKNLDFRHTDRKLST